MINPKQYDFSTEKVFVINEIIRQFTNYKRKVDSLYIGMFSKIVNVAENDIEPLDLWSGLFFLVREGFLQLEGNYINQDDEIFPVPVEDIWAGQQTGLYISPESGEYVAGERFVFNFVYDPEIAKKFWIEE